MVTNHRVVITKTAATTTSTLVTREPADNACHPTSVRSLSNHPQTKMSDKRSMICLAVTSLCIRYLYGSSVFAIAHSTYSMNHASGAQSRSPDDQIWIVNTAYTIYDYLLRSTNTWDIITTATRIRYLAVMQIFTTIVTKVADMIECPSLVFALSSAWPRALWMVVVIAAYWLGKCLSALNDWHEWRYYSPCFDMSKFGSHISNQNLLKLSFCSISS